MAMATRAVVMAVGLLMAGQAWAEPPAPPLRCSGLEPNWTFDVEQGHARFKPMDGDAETLPGSWETTLRLPNESLWRGGPADRIVVAVIRREQCSDTMSDERHPYSIVLSRPDELLVGCCRESPPAQ